MGKAQPGRRASSSTDGRTKRNERAFRSKAGLNGLKVDRAYLEEGLRGNVTITLPEFVCVLCCAV